MYANVARVIIYKKINFTEDNIYYNYYNSKKMQLKIRPSKLCLVSYTGIHLQKSLYLKSPTSKYTIIHYC